MNPRVKKKDARWAVRVQFDVAEAKLRQAGSRGIMVRIRDLSSSGFRAEWPHAARPGQTFWLTLPGLSPIRATAVWSRSFEVGCRFEAALHPAVLDMLLKTHRATLMPIG